MLTANVKVDAMEALPPMGALYVDVMCVYGDYGNLGPMLSVLPPADSGTLAGGVA